MEKGQCRGSLSKGEGEIEAVVRGCILWGYQALHVRDGVTGSRFLRRNTWGKRELCSLSAPYERLLLRRVGVGGDRGASSSACVVEGVSSQG
jgi:hypothetical protein